MLTVNEYCCRKGLRSVASGLPICVVLAGLSLPIRAHAQFTGKAAATAQFESNSNVFDVSSGFAQLGPGDVRRGDTDLAYGAEVDATYLWGRQQIFAKASTKEYDYQHFSELNHNDYRADGGLNWKLGDFLDGKLDVSRTHTMVPFFDLAGSALTLSLLDELRETVVIGFRLNSDWKLESTAFTSIGDQTSAQGSFIQLTQSSGALSIEYLGIGGLTSGLTAAYLSGDYSGANAYLTPSYSQSTIGLLADYKLSRTVLEGQVGYSRRVSADGTDNTSGLTGLVDFKWKLTPKTSVKIKVSRAINSYFLNSGSEIDTEAGADVNWQATYKLAVSAGYTFSYRDYPGQGNNPVGSDRIDIQETMNMGIDYQLRRWLVIRPYANVQTRRSTFIGAHYSSDIFGISVTVTPYDLR